MVPGIEVTLEVYASELKRDVERIENGELDLPTVSAVRICCDGIFDEDLLVWLPEA
jgi:hypothetical protein